MSDLLKLAEQSAKAKDYEAAEKHCLAHLATSPDDLKALRYLAFVHSLGNKYADAVGVVSRVIDLSDDKVEPADCFNRGRWNLQLRRFAEAAGDFSEAERLCERYGDNYYLESACLLEAAAFVQMGQISDAKRALLKVSDECQAFAMGRLFSKQSLTNEINA